MSLIGKLRMYRRVFARGRDRPAFARLLRKRPALMLAVGAYEAALIASDRVEPRLKTLASLKTSSLIGCPF